MDCKKKTIQKQKLKYKKREFRSSKMRAQHFYHHQKKLLTHRFFSLFSPLSRTTRILDLRLPIRPKLKTKKVGISGKKTFLRGV